MELAILIGLQGSGKTTFRRRCLPGHLVVSKDLLRNNPRPARRQRQLLEEALEAGRSTVVDNTNPTLADREELIALGRQFGAEIVGYVFPPSVPDSLARNRTRVGKERVPDVAIFSTAKRFQPPRPEEGYDRLYQVELNETQEFVVTPWSEEKS